MSHGTCEALWVRSLSTDLGKKVPILMYGDNQAALCILKNSVLHERTKHINYRGGFPFHS